MVTSVARKTIANEKILVRVRKLLEHVRHNENASEAATATAFVQKLMMEYNITEQEIAEFEGRPAPSPVTAEYLPYSSKKGRIMWQFSLFCEVARCYFCKFLSYNSRNEGIIIGEDMNRTVAKMVYFYLRDEIERMHRISFSQHKATSRNPMHGRAYYNQFCSGATDVVNSRLLQQFRSEQASNNKANALIVLKDKLVEEKTAELFPRHNTVNTRIKTARTDGYYAGMKAGQSIPLKPGARQIAA